MKAVFLTALGVGGATLLGAVLGLIFKKISHRAGDIILSFAAGVMLAASVLGLVIPSVEYGGGGAKGLLIAVVGIFLGALTVNAFDKLVPHLHKLTGIDPENGEKGGKVDKVLLFVLAIAIHNLPEGIAAGVGFGTDNAADGILIAVGIALQNIPEGIAIIAPMLSAGIKPRRTFLIAAATGAVEVVGTLFGYLAVTLAQAILPFGLAFAGGTMLYIISDEMIPETHAHGSERGATYALIAGFCLMLVMDVLLG